MKTQNSPCAYQVGKNNKAVFSSIKSKVEKLTKSTHKNSNDLLDGFLAFNENFKKKGCSEKANNEFDVELSEYNEANFLIGNEDLGF
jgi:hypothetical protein